MKRLFSMSLSALLLLSTFFAGSATSAAAKEPKILKFDTMVGIPAGLTGAQSQAPLRGLSGGGLPWTVAEASGELRADGHLKIRVQGLVLAAGTNAGLNPIPNFRGVVNCVKSDGTFDNIPTDLFPATTGPAAAGGGNAEIEADVVLPQPCIAPIVFVTGPPNATNPIGAWFAATGF